MSFKIIVPSGLTSTDRAQSFNLGCMAPDMTKWGESTWNADTGGWWLTCSVTIRKSSSSLERSSKQHKTVIKKVIKIDLKWTSNKI